MSVPSTPQWLVSRVMLWKPSRSAGESHRWPRTALPFTHRWNMFSTATARPRFREYCSISPSSHAWYFSSNRNGGWMTTTPASSWWARSTDRSMMSKKFGPHTRRVTTSIGAWTAQMVRPYFFARSRGAVADWVSGSGVAISSTASTAASAMPAHPRLDRRPGDVHGGDAGDRAGRPPWLDTRAVPGLLPLRGDDQRAVPRRGDRGAAVEAAVGGARVRGPRPRRCRLRGRR